jgi:hypothetical protein
MQSVSKITTLATHGLPTMVGLFFEYTPACQPGWARPTLTAASGNVRAVRPTLFGKLSTAI